MPITDKVILFVALATTLPVRLAIFCIKQKTAYEIRLSLVSSEMGIGDRLWVKLANLGRLVGQVRPPISCHSARFARLWLDRCPSCAGLFRSHRSCHPHSLCRQARFESVLCHWPFHGRENGVVFGRLAARPRASFGTDGPGWFSGSQRHWQQAL